MPTLELHVFLPQMRLAMPDLVRRAQAAEEAGFTGMALMDHLSPPGAPGHPMFEAMTTATWLLANTTSLTVGHLVLCDAFRHPAVLASQAVTLDHASGGRFELGIGWGSVPDELVRFGITDDGPAGRASRLEETVAVVTALWSGEPVTFDGAHHHVDDAQQLPVPTTRIPLVIGGAGPRAIHLSAEHADWWNCPVYALDRFDELRAQVGPARASTQEVVAFAPRGIDIEAVRDLAMRRFGYLRDHLVVGDASAMVDHFAELGERGVERAYVWMTDFANPDTLRAFGDEVIGHLR